MPRINTDCNSQFTDVGLVGMKRGAETVGDFIFRLDLSFKLKF